MRPDCAYQLVHDEMNLDGNPALNLASFETTWMEPQATQLVIENIHKKFADQFEYPQTRRYKSGVLTYLPGSSMPQNQRPLQELKQ
jgi:glutamate decarboxylase